MHARPSSAAATLLRAVGTTLPLLGFHHPNFPASRSEVSHILLVFSPPASLARFSVSLCLPPLLPRGRLPCLVGERFVRSIERRCGGAFLGWDAGNSLQIVFPGDTGLGFLVESRFFSCRWAHLPGCDILIISDQ